MKKNILIMICTLSGLLNAMGVDVNYDEKFDSAERSQVTTTVSEPVKPTPPPKEVKIKETSTQNPLEGLVLKSLYFQKKIINKKGKKFKKYVEVKDALIESKVTYITKLINNTTVPRKDIVVKNPLPLGVKYVLGTASCLDACTIRYSADNGATFVETDKGGEEYNFIEFTFSSVPAKKEFRMGFDTIIQ